MYYPESLIQDVITQNDIVDVISSYVKLNKRGSNHVGLCPFHNEKTGSFTVTQSKQMYKCFGCGVGGNVITFIKEYENFSFPEAVEFLANRAGIELPKVDDAAERIKNNKKQRLLDINREAGKFYYAMLRSPNGRKGYDYLTGRELSEEAMKKFGLGYARAGQNETYRYLKGKGFSDEDLRDSGLFTYNERNGMMDKFWNRVIFPIMDVNSRIIGFGGRVMGEGEPKYLNSPETMIFDKGRNLYGLNLARTSRKKNMILCEGYMDVIALHQAGFNQAVASLGTAFTSGQANLLRRYVGDVLLCYDSDGAGVKAALRAFPILKAAGISAKVINMQPYKDPDEFIKNLGADEFQKRMENAENAFYFEARMVEAEYDIKDPEGKTKFLTDMARRLLRFDEEIERENYIEGLAAKYKVSVESLSKLVAKYAMMGEGIKLSEPPKSGKHSANSENTAVLEAQGYLLTWLCDEPELYEAVKKYITVDDFADELCRKVAKTLFEQIENGSLNPAMIISMFEADESESNVASLFNADLVIPDNREEKQEYLNALIRRIKKNGIEYRAKTAVDESPEALQKLLMESSENEALSDRKINID